MDCLRQIQIDTKKGTACNHAKRKDVFALSFIIPIPSLFGFRFLKRMRELLDLDEGEEEYAGLGAPPPPTPPTSFASPGSGPGGLLNRKQARGSIHKMTVGK